MLVDDKKKTVKLSAICSKYKETFLRLGSREYKKMTHDRFLEKLKENIKWRDVVNERYDDDPKKKCFVGVEEKDCDDDES